MKTTLFEPLHGAAGPFATVSFDVSRNTPDAGREADLRLRALLEELANSGAGPDLLEAISEAAGSVTEHTAGDGQQSSGHRGRLIVANENGVLLDLLLPQPPVRDESLYGPAPHLLPVFRALQSHPSHVLVDIDRAGADIAVIGPLATAEATTSVEGSHDELHRVPGSLMSTRRFQARVEDSWQRNAEEVATVLAPLVRKHRPAAVLVRGDEKAVSALVAAAPGDLNLTKVEGGGRAAGSSGDAEQEAVDAVLQAIETAARQKVLDSFATAEGRQEDAVQGFDAVIETLRRGQIEELLLHDDPTSTLTVWVGDQPSELGLDRGELDAMGAGSAGRTRADAAVVWALVSTGAGITLLTEDDPDLRDGIGAVLRWSDRSTPHDAVPSMPGYGQRRSADDRSPSVS